MSKKTAATIRASRAPMTARERQIAMESFMVVEHRNGTATIYDTLDSASEPEVVRMSRLQARLAEIRESIG